MNVRKVLTLAILIPLLALSVLAQVTKNTGDSELRRAVSHTFTSVGSKELTELATKLDQGQYEFATGESLPDKLDYLEGSLLLLSTLDELGKKTITVPPGFKTMDEAHRKKFAVMFNFIYVFSQTLSDSEKKLIAAYGGDAPTIRNGNDTSSTTPDEKTAMRKMVVKFEVVLRANYDLLEKLLVAYPALTQEMGLRPLTDEASKLVFRQEFAGFVADLADKLKELVDES